MIDFYLGGLPSSFVSAVFSSFPGAALGRSLLCCTHRVHFGAVAKMEHGHSVRDGPMLHPWALQALTQVAHRHRSVSSIMIEDEATRLAPQITRTATDVTHVRLRSPELRGKL